MSDLEKILFGAAIMTLIGLVVWLIQANFNDLKKRLDDIAERMVTKEVCRERHRPLDDKVKNHDGDIRRLFGLVHHEPTEQNKEV